MDNIKAIKDDKKILKDLYKETKISYNIFTTKEISRKHKIVKPLTGP